MEYNQGVDPFDTVIGFKGKLALVAVTAAAILSSGIVGYHLNDVYDKN